MIAREKESVLNRKALRDLFTTRFALITKHTEICNRLDTMRLEDVRSEEGDDYMALEKRTQRIDQLARLARIKYRDDKAKVRRLARTFIETQWRLSALQRTHDEKSYQRLMNAIYDLMYEIWTDKFEKQYPAKKDNDVFQKLLWKSTVTNSSNDKQDSANDMFLTNLFEAFFASQRRWGRNPSNVERSRSGQKSKSNSNQGVRQQSTKGPCFNGNRVGCLLKKGKHTRNCACIKASLKLWKARRKLRKPYGVNVAEYKEHAEDDTELMEVLLAQETLNDVDQDDNVYYPRNTEEKGWTNTKATSNSNTSARRTQAQQQMRTFTKTRMRTQTSIKYFS